MGVKDKKFSSDNCPETREFSQTCSMEELPSGVKILLQNQKLAKEKESIYKKKIEKVNAFFVDVKNGLRSIIENQQQNVLLHQNTHKACKETVDKFKSQNIEMNFLKNELTKVKSSSVSSNTDGKIFTTKSDETLSTNVVDKCTLEKNKLEQMNQNSLTELERIKKEEFLMNVEI